MKFKEEIMEQQPFESMVRTWDCTVLFVWKYRAASKSVS